MTKSGSTDWADWLTKKETKLQKLGYRRYVQEYKNADFIYWKPFKTYQIGVCFYDFRNEANRIEITYECILMCEELISMTVKKRIDLEEFENMAEKFCVAMWQD